MENYPLSLEQSLVVEKESWKELVLCSMDEARKALSFELAERLLVLPLGIVEDGSHSLLSVLAAEDLSHAELSELKFASGYDVIYEKKEKEVLEKAIYAAYRGSSLELSRASSKANLEFGEFEKVDFKPEELESVVPKLLNQIIERGIALDASDIHLEPVGKGARVRYRVNGLLEVAEISLKREVFSGLIRKVKVLSGLDHTITSLVQEGAFSYCSASISRRLRISILPQLDSEKLVIRILDSNFVGIASGDSKFQKLGLRKKQENLLLSFLGADSGTILIAGPTGSGKSTLLYTILEYLNSEWRNIITIEDPVERLLRGVNQTQVNLEAKLGYKELIPSLLRQDPDVVMLGEIRDAESAETALTAGITGHLVLSTVHARNCLEVFVRLIELGLSELLLATSLRLLVSQRLLQKNCWHCSKKIKPSLALQKFFSIESDVELCQSKGCEKCAATGYSNRIAVFEMLAVNQEIQSLLLNRKAEGEFTDFLTKLKKAAYSASYEPYAFSVREALLQGAVSPKVALRSLGVAPEMYDC